MNPALELAVSAQRALDFDQAGRPVVGAGELLFAGPGDLNGLARHTSQTRRLDLALGAMLAAESSAGIDRDDVNLGLRQVQRFGNFRAHGERSLRAGADLHRTIL